MIQIDESRQDELRIIQKGSKRRGLYFVLMGSIFQILFLWAYWSFLDTSGPWAIVWLSLINSDFLPFISILFLFGGGCFLIAIRELGWIVTLTVKRDLLDETPGIQRSLQLFSWTRLEMVLNKQINSLRIHTVALDKLELHKRYHLEITYQNSRNVVENLVLYTDDGELASAMTLQLATKIQEILKLPGEIERTESSTKII
ncbi:MAG: hypothetical protein JSV04_07395 [Candidatus Heimdallarchaeota archaeon]|nr:MAG: hypothetical protein JSV04_07395 [Candidatus Heimdallarchaeota archaeon]